MTLHFANVKTNDILTTKFNRFLQIFFLITHLFVIFVNDEIFFQKYIEMELKMFFIVFEE